MSQPRFDGWRGVSADVLVFVPPQNDRLIQLAQRVWAHNLVESCYPAWLLGVVVTLGIDAPMALPALRMLVKATNREARAALHAAALAGINAVTMYAMVADLAFDTLPTNRAHRRATEQYRKKRARRGR